MFEKMALFASITLPLWNIPLIFRIIKRKSANDISFFWAFGVWFSLLLILPNGIMSSEIVWKAFSISNFFLFSIVFMIVVYYKIKEK